MSEENKVLGITMPEDVQVEGSNLTVPTNADIEKQVSERNPIEAAATLFEFYFPIYRNCLHRLSNKQLRRLLSALIEVPLNGKEYKILDKTELEVYRIADRLLQAKWSMMLFTLMQHNEELRQATEEVETPNELKIGDQALTTESKGE